MKLLFVCEYNACRSQMAEGIARHLLPKSVTVQSAGLHPGQINPITIEVMREIGIDISSQRSKLLESVSDEDYDTVINLAEPAREAVKKLRAKKWVDWFHADPAAGPGSDKEKQTRMRRVRDALQKQIATLVANR